MRNLISCLWIAAIAAFLLGLVPLRDVPDDLVESVDRGVAVGRSGEPFEGVFDTPEGRLRLRRVGDRILGIYADGDSPGTLTGHTEAGRLALAWRGAEEAGDGWIELDAAGETFAGAWREADDENWHEWRGHRVAPDLERRWLVVLEGYWEDGLEAPDYSLGEIARAYFGYRPELAVRHRRFGDRAVLETLVRQVALLAEPVFLVIAAHGEDGGIFAGGDHISAAELGAMLRDAPNVVGVHLSSCAMMTQSTPDEFEAGIAERRVPLSGFSKEVDWAGSALIELLYLDLVVAREMPPADAARVVSAQLAFAGEVDPFDSPLGAAGFRLVGSEPKPDRLSAHFTRAPR